MPLPTLEALTATLDATAVALLGDTLLFTPASGAPVTRGFVDLGETARDFGITAAVDREITVELRVTDAPLRPGRADRLTIAALPGRTFVPIDAKLEGTMWRFGVKDAPDA